MKTIITSALVISGVMGSAMAEPVSCEQSRDLFGSLSGHQDIMPSKDDSLGLGSSIKLTGFVLNTASKKEEPKLARSNSFDDDTKAQPFMSEEKHKVVAEPGLFTRVINWVKSIFGF